VLARISITSLPHLIVDMTTVKIAAVLFLFLLAPVTIGSMLRSSGGPHASWAWMLSSCAFTSADAAIDITMQLAQGCKSVLFLGMVLSDAVIALGVALRGHLGTMRAAAAANNRLLGIGMQISPPPYTRVSCLLCNLLLLFTNIFPLQYSFSTPSFRYCSDVLVDLDHT
jgi:hypothetical protein